MGKSKKARLKRVDPLAHKQKTNLSEEIETGDRIKGPTQKQGKVRFRQEEDDYVDHKLTRKILKEALEQQKELEDETRISGTSKKKSFAVPKLVSKDDSDLEDDLDNDWPSLSDDANSNEQPYMDEEIQIDGDDEEALKLFMNPNPAARRTLADVIMDKITEKKTEVSTLLPDTENLMPDLDPLIIESYKDLKQLLMKYRSGKLPRQFKSLPSLKNWEELLFIAEPDSWSAAAIYQATRVFASNLNTSMAQRFFNLVLLPRIRDDIDYFKRLNFHLFMALKKALFKPAAFFRGIILPLCEEGTCTLREATIISGVLAKCSVPVLHACAAMKKIATMNYSGANSIFLRVLIMKKYALPFTVIDELVFHFCQFRHEKRKLPVLWHQALLAFVEIYRNNISDEQAESLRELVRHQFHDKITPEIHQQLMTRESREVVMTEPI